MRDLYPHADRLFAFIRERHAIWERRNKGLPKPWTEDPILQSYRFCNVYRELDKETTWIRNNWRNDSDPDNWFAMVVARLINWSPTLEVVGYPVPWRPSTFLRRIQALEDKGVKVWGGAYIVSTNGAKQPKAEYLTEQVLTPLWNARKEIRPRPDDTLEAFYDRLRRFRGMGSFIAAQVVADAKFVAPLTQAPDWESFAASGPGSRRGLARVMGMPDIRASWPERLWRERLSGLKVIIDQKVKEAGMPVITGQDLQNCLCEFDKYERVRLGQGRPKAKYPGKE